jgi:probable HAF family extracellular repeat protein
LAYFAYLEDSFASLRFAWKFLQREQRKFLGRLSLSSLCAGLIIQPKTCFMSFNKAKTAASSINYPRSSTIKCVFAAVRRGLKTLRRNGNPSLADDTRAAGAVLCLMLLPVGCCCAAQRTYTITDLGIAGEWYSEAHGLNNNGWAVGEYEAGGALYQRSFLYDGQTTAGLNIPPNTYDIAWGINDSNVIVGEYLPNPNPLTFYIEAYKYSNGISTGLGYLASVNYSTAHGINRQGQIVGGSSTNSSGSVIHAVLWNTNGAKVDLGVLGGTYSSANAINNSGIIVGDSSVEGSTNTQAFIYTNSISPLGTLGGDYSSPKGINDAGVVVGESTEVTAGVTNLQAFIYQNGTMTSLRIQAAALGADSSSASAINNLGQVVGYLGFGQFIQAFLFDGTNMVNLNQYIPSSSAFVSLGSADGINDKGQIIGSGTTTNGDYHGYLLTPVSSTPWILLSAPTMAGGSGFQMTIEGLPGEQFVVQASTDLSTSNWVSLYTNVLSGSQTNYTDPAAPNWTARYYRALLSQQ